MDLLLEDDDAVGRRNSDKVALRLAVVGEVRRPIPVVEQVQQLVQTFVTDVIQNLQETKILDAHGNELWYIEVLTLFNLWHII